MSSINPLDNSGTIQVPATPVRYLSHDEMRAMRPLIRTVKPRKVGPKKSRNAVMVANKKLPRSQRNPRLMAAKKARRLENILHSAYSLIAEINEFCEQLNEFVKLYELQSELYADYNLQPSSVTILTANAKVGPFGMGDVVIFVSKPDPRRMIARYRDETERMLQAEIDAAAIPDDGPAQDWIEDVVAELDAADARKAEQAAAQNKAATAEMEKWALQESAQAQDEENAFANSQWRRALGITKNFERQQNEQAHDAQVEFEKRQPHDARTKSKEHKKTAADYAHQCQQAEVAYDLTQRALKKTLRRMKARLK